MTSQNLFWVQTQFKSEKMGSVNEFLYQKLLLFACALWFSVSTYMLPLFSFITASLLRFKVNENSSKNNSMVIAKENIKQETNFTDPELKLKQGDIGFMYSQNDRAGEKEEPDLCFKFKFPTYEEFSKNRGENGDCVTYEALSAANTSKYEFVSGKSFSGFIDEPEVMKFKVEELKTDTKVGFLLDEGFKEITGNLSNGVCEKDETKEIDELSLKEEKVQAVNAEKNLLGDENVHDEVQFPSEKHKFSVESNHLDSILTCLIDSYGEGFLSVGEFDPHKIEDENKESEDFEECHHTQTNFHLEKEFDEESKFGEYSGEDNKPMDCEETNKLETLWEHQELVEQLKMELKKVRDTGLPTILEESDHCPKIMEDLKPWKIDDHGNPMGELHKFYKSYRERMRKFDILNYQKMYALGFLQLKDPLQSITTPKSPVSEFTSLLSQNFYPQKHKKNENDPTTKFVKELQSDLEVIYVGQMCLSWEFLHWQYAKALDIWESDTRGIRLFNEVAGEFQQFQVLMQRFVEDETFQGPRVQNYVRNRCTLRNLLQVPVIREDKLKDKRKARIKDRNEYAITSDMLVEIIEETIRIFWKFVRADKDCANVIAKGRNETTIELQDPADFELLSDVLKNLQEKERKLKDQLRSGNCILRRFKKGREESNSDQVLYFFSQVDMKLVSRVLNMSRLTTEQLVWCHSKLRKVSFANRKIHVEPSFLLFPC